MLNRLNKRLEQREGGFTLIELLIVIVILGILAGIVVFAVGTARDDSVNAACEADKKTVSVALEAYKAKEGDYPTGTQDADDNDLVGDYMKSWPESDEYTITSSGGTVSPDDCPAAG